MRSTVIAFKYFILYFVVEDFGYLVPKSTGEKKAGKPSDTSPVATRSGTESQKQQQQKVNQALRVPAVSLNPSCKKVHVIDLLPFDSEDKSTFSKVLVNESDGFD
ncbi:rap guanine nucleotide exchange factor 2-like isoform X2 [Heterodontus francisci]|uniref:rap guanine nucleotide exchange factor 2-like isoform X2 n=1 Tax=Heterodontus francisci TaxID=7792 RepID=UPI00355C7A97